ENTAVGLRVVVLDPQIIAFPGGGDVLLPRRHAQRHGAAQPLDEDLPEPEVIQHGARQPHQHRQNHRRFPLAHAGTDQEQTEKNQDRNQYPIEISNHACLRKSLYCSVAAFAGGAGYVLMIATVDAGDVKPCNSGGFIYCAAWTVHCIPASPRMWSAVTGSTVKAPVAPVILGHGGR